MNFRHANHVARSSLHRINNYEWQRQHTLSLCVRTRAVRAVACKRDVTPAIWRDFFRLNASAPCKRASFDAGIFDGSSHELGFDFERRAREREFWLMGTHLWPLRTPKARPRRPARPRPHPGFEFAPDTASIICERPIAADGASSVVPPY
jgi:hypothetical protein